MSNANAMSPETLRAKYGDTKVGVVPAESVPLGAGLPGLLRDLHRNLDFLPRWQMETDPSYLQPIPYVLVMNERGEYLATWRKQGDDRLVGMISLGIGGHMDEGEHDIQETLYRELNEELILNGMDERPLCEFMGIIREEKNPVDRVHLGLVYRVLVSDNATVRETDVLEGAWLTPERIQSLHSKLESWGQICFDRNYLIQPMGHRLLTTKILKTYERKNSDYGNSFAETHKLFGAVAGLTRIHDKLNRIAQLSSGKEQKVLDEKLMDTVLDGATYCLMEIEQMTGKNLWDIAAANLADSWPIPFPAEKYIAYLMNDMLNADEAVLKNLGSPEYFLSCVFNDLIHYAARIAGGRL